MGSGGSVLKQRVMNWKCYGIPQNWGDRRGGGCHLARWLLRKITGGDPPGIKELRGDLPMSYHSPGPAVDSRP